MSAATIIRLLIGDQLNPRHSWFERADPIIVHLMMAVRRETDVVTHHIQKVEAFFSAMRAFANAPGAGGHRVVCLTLEDPADRRNTLAWADRCLSNIEAL